jgi:hypothetical protein
MPKLAHILLATAAALVLWSGSLWAQDQQRERPANSVNQRSPDKPPLGSVARQVRLKLNLEKQSKGNLENVLAHSRREWDKLSPEQRQRFRREAYAFLQKNPQEQDRLIEHYTQFIEMSAERQEAYRQRAKWLAVVVESFTPEERRRLAELSPEQRAKELLDRKAELISQGKLLEDSGDASQTPATMPSTAP